MVQFGQTLNEVVKQAWAPHAVPYTQLKQALRPATISDDNSVHTESSYAISDVQKRAFERIYDESVVRLVEFYEDKSSWAGDRAGELGEEIALCLAGGMSMEDVPGLIDRLQGFSKELGLVLEFLELNSVAFSKIMKKVRARCRRNCQFLNA
jgi:SPX domain protein involved in polyphosphate accumulation